MPRRSSTHVSFMALCVSLAIGGGMFAPSSSSVSAAETWSYATTDHFEVYTTGGQRRAREALTYFERVHGFFEDFLKLSPKQVHPTRLIVFSNGREYAPYRISAVAAAYYRRGPDRDYIVMGSLDSESYPVVVHEYAHLIIRHSGGVFPLWLNEGLAEFFSTLAPEGRQMSLGKVPLGRLAELVNGGPMLDLSRLLAVDHDSPEYNTKGHAGMFYAQSWALTHMLMTADGYRTRRDAFIAAVTGTSSAEEAFRSVFGKSLIEVAADLRAYVRRDQFGYFTVDYREPKQTGVVPVRVTPAFEAGLVTANLLAEGMTTEDAARTAYERLEASNPDDLGLLEARGYFELRRGKRDAAKIYLARAVAANSRNPAIYKGAAALANGDEQGPLLKSALSLAPDDLEIRLAYAAHLARQTQPALVIDTLAPVTRVSPEQAFLFFQLQAASYAAMDRIDEAKAFAARARQHARAGSETSYADDLVRAINDYGERRAASERAIQEYNAARDAAAAARAARALEPETPTTNDAVSPSTRSGLSKFGGEPQTTIAGRVRHIDCMQAPAVLELVTSAGVIVRLEIDDPLKIEVVGAGGPTVDLTCGPQNKPARLGYTPRVNDALKTVGAVRMLDFQ